MVLVRRLASTRSSGGYTRNVTSPSSCWLAVPTSDIAEMLLASAP